MINRKNYDGLINNNFDLKFKKNHKSEKVVTKIKIEILQMIKKYQCYNCKLSDFDR